MKKHLNSNDPAFTAPDAEQHIANEILAGLRDALDYAQGKKAAYVSRYEDGKCVSAGWQMADGTKVDMPEELKANGND